MSETEQPLDMRYDGAPRRSQKQDKDWLDHLWSFFSSVRVGVWLIVLTLLGAAVGSIYPQEEAFLAPPGLEYYETTYGWTGKWYYLLGLSHTYTSWWFNVLVVMLGTSIVIASLDRGIPLYKALAKQKADRSRDFLQRQKITFEAELPFPESDARAAEEWANRFGQGLAKQHFRVMKSGTAVLGEKNRWSRWGPYVNHVGLVIFLLIILVRTLPGFMMEEYVWVLEGDTVPIKSTDYYIKNEKFTVEFYGSEELQGQFRAEDRIVPKLFETQAVLYKCSERCGTSDPVLNEVARDDIIVNHPLEFQGMSVYQFGYELTPQIRSVSVSLKDKLSGKDYGKFTLKTQNPDLAYEAGPYKLRLHNYYPEFSLDAQGEPTSVSASKPNAPAYIFIITGPDLPAEGVSYIYFPREVDKIRFQQDKLNAGAGGGDRFSIEAGGMEDVEISTYTSILTVRSDQTVPFLLLGGIICMIGLIMTFYWQHRRIWVRVDGNRLIVGAHTNKNWHGMKREAQKLLESVNLDASGLRSETNKEVSSS